MRHIRFLVLALASACAFPAQAQPVSYASKSRTVNAGVLLIASQNYGNPVPHVWYHLNQDDVVKPAEWTFDCPLSQTRLTDSAFARWNPLGAPPVGTKVGKADAPYWEVVLSNVSDSQLALFDVLSLSIVGSGELSAPEREKLRRYVDGGGILWVDVNSTAGLPAMDPANSLPAPFMLQIDGSPQVANVFHPALRYPNVLGLNDVSAMSFPGINYSARPVNVGDLGSLATALGRTISDTNLSDVVAQSAGGGRTISVGRFGDGFVVVTSRGIHKTINRGVFQVYPVVYDNDNSNFTSSKVRLDSAFYTAAKFSTNILSLATSYSTPGLGARKSSAASAEAGAPAIRRWVGPSTGSNAAPVLFGGRVVAVHGNQVVVYDAKANRDLDRDLDANPDDGAVDPVGQPMDIVWTSAPLGASLSGASVVEVPGAPFVEQVWVVDDASNVYGFSLSSSGLNVAPAVTIAPPAGTLTGTVPGAPAFHDGVGYVYDRTNPTQGRIWAFNPRTGSKDVSGSGSGDWAVLPGGLLLPGRMPLSIGLIPINDQSSGSDIVSFAAMDPAGPGNAAGVLNYWIGAKGESPRTVTWGGGATVTVQTRAGARNAPVVVGGTGPTGLRVTLLDPSGNPAPTALLQTYLTGVVAQPSAGTLSIGLTPAGMASGWDWDGNATPVTTDDVGFRIDYTLDMSGGGFPGVQGGSYVRGHVHVIDEASPRLAPVGPVAMSPAGTIGFAVATPTAPFGGTFYVLEPLGENEMAVRSRFEFHDALTNLNVLGLPPTPYPPALVDEDQINALIPFLNSPMTSVRPVGVAATDDAFYVTAAGVKNVFGFPVDTSAILAFKANPAPLQLELGLGVISPNSNIVLKQADVAKSLVKTAPSLFSTLAANSFTIEPIPNTRRARLVISNLASASNGNLNSCLANNLPLTIVRDGQTETLVEPEATVDSGPFIHGHASGNYSHLLWYMVMNGYQAKSAPIVTGKTMFMGGDSYLPSLVTTGVPSLAQNGLMYAMDTRVSSNDPHMKSTAARPWVTQLYLLDNVTAAFNFSNVSVAEAVQWPEFRGIEEFDDFRVRLLQASLSDAGVNAFSAGDGAVAAEGTNNLHVFSRSDFVVVDAGRVSRFDPSGNPLWSSDQTTYAGVNEPITNAQNVRKMSSPTRMYQLADLSYVVVDPGNDAVIRVDAAGREIRTVKTARLHPDMSPNGITPNEPLQLRRPQDVMFWSTTHTAAEVQARFPSEGGYRAYTDERWDHWLVADAGNNRVVELIDRYMLDAQGRVTGIVRFQDPHNHEGDGLTNAYGVMVWHTPEELSGKKFAYNALDRARLALGGGGSKTVFAFSFNNVEPGLRTFGLDNPLSPDVDNPMGYGGVVIYDGPATRVITEFDVPALPANIYVGENPPGSGNYAFNLPTVPDPVKTLKVSGIRSVTMRYVDDGAGPELAVMMSLDSGVYEVKFNTGSGRWETRWMLPREAYVVMRRPRTAVTFNTFDLRNNPRNMYTMHARRLDSGDVLLVNGYSGTTFDGSAFTGEVVLVDGSFTTNAALPDGNPGYNINRRNLGFGSLSVLFELPPVQGIRGIISPVFAERQ